MNLTQNIKPFFQLQKVTSELLDISPALWRLRRCHSSAITWAVWCAEEQMWKALICTAITLSPPSPNSQKQNLWNISWINLPHKPRLIYDTAARLWSWRTTASALKRSARRRGPSSLSVIHEAKESPSNMLGQAAESGDLKVNTMFNLGAKLGEHDAKKRPLKLNQFT